MIRALALANRSTRSARSYIEAILVVWSISSTMTLTLRGSFGCVMGTLLRSRAGGDIQLRSRAGGDIQLGSRAGDVRRRKPCAATSDSAESKVDMRTGGDLGGPRQIAVAASNQNASKLLSWGWKWVELSIVLPSLLTPVTEWSSDSCVVGGRRGCANRSSPRWSTTSASQCCCRC